MEACLGNLIIFTFQKIHTNYMEQPYKYQFSLYINQASERINYKKVLKIAYNVTFINSTLSYFNKLFQKNKVYFVWKKKSILFLFPPPKANQNWPGGGAWCWLVHSTVCPGNQSYRLGKAANLPDGCGGPLVYLKITLAKQQSSELNGAAEKKDVGRQDITDF